MGRSSGIAAVLALALVGPPRAGAATLRGVVLAEDGTPAAGARVWAYKVVPLQALDRREGVADRDGRFALAVEPGNYRLDASLADQGSVLHGDAYFVAAGGDDPPPVTIRLRAQGRLRVRLVADETGRPIAGGRLVLENGLDPTTDAEGRLEVRGLDRGGHREALVVAPGRERKRILFEMADGPTTDLEVAVPRGGRVVGRVLDTAGRPVPTAKVALALPAPDLALQSCGWVGVDAQGRFDFDGLPVDRGTPLVASADGYISDTQNNLRPEPDGTPADIEFQIPPQAPARGRGGPVFIGGNGVAFFGGGDPPPRSRTRVVAGRVVDLQRRPVAATVRWTPGVEAQTDAAGRFRLPAVPDQDGTIFVIPGRADLAPEIEEIGAGDQEIAVALPPGRTAAGVVRDDRGAPFAGVDVFPTITQVGLSLPERATRTDAAGRFAIAGLPDAAASGFFSGAGLLNLAGQALRLDAENVVTMTTTGAIPGEVVDPAGRPVRVFRVLLNPPRAARPDDPGRWQFPGLGGLGLNFAVADGRFLVRHLSPGSVHRVTVLAPGYGEATLDRVVAEPRNRWDGARRIVFRLTPPRTLRVHVVAQDTGRPVADARVALAYEPIPVANYNWNGSVNAPSESIRARTDAAGLATFDPLSLSEARVLVRAPGFARRHITWGDGAAELTIPLEPEAVVDGAALDAATGGAFEGAFVYLLSPTNGQLDITPRFGDGGRFRFGEVPAGSYSLEVHNSTGQVHAEAVELRAGEHLTRVLKLSTVPQFNPANGN